MTADRPDPRYHPVPLAFRHLPPEEQHRALHDFVVRMRERRTVRHYSSEPVPDSLIEEAIAVAGTAPSGANMQPWRFVVVRDPDVKRRIREAAEEEERTFYEQRAPADWLDALAPLGTDWHKEFLEVAPVLIVVFRIDYGVRAGCRRRRAAHQALLRPGVGRHRLRLPAGRPAPGRPGHAHPYAQPHGLPGRDPRPAEERETLPADSRRVPGGRRGRAGNHEEADWRDSDTEVVDGCHVGRTRPYDGRTCSHAERSSGPETRAVVPHSGEAPPGLSGVGLGRTVRTGGVRMFGILPVVVLAEEGQCVVVSLRVAVVDEEVIAAMGALQRAGVADGAPGTARCARRFPGRTQSARSRSRSKRSSPSRCRSGSRASGDRWRYGGCATPVAHRRSESRSTDRWRSTGRRARAARATSR